MTPERYQQIDRITDAVLELPDEERAAFLDQVCADDDELRKQVERLLKAHEHESSFMEAPALEEAAKDLASNESQSFVGRKLGHYQILSMVGSGGMGEVYKAEDLKLGRTVALKLLPAGNVTDTQSRRRFLREARAASALNHPNIVTIHAIEQADGQDFIVMEFVEGRTLKALIETQPLGYEQVVSLGIQIADALSAAHSAGIIHRDIKPANLLVTAQGNAKVLDFGLAKKFRSSSNSLNQDAEVSTTGITEAGLIMGTVSYMSPEQARGEDLDARSDVFSLGCVLYEAATGKRPFNGGSALSVMHEIATADPVPTSSINPKLPTEFDSLIQRCLAKEKESRLQSAAELAEELKGLNLSTRQGHKTYSTKNPRKKISRSTIIATLLSILVVVTGLLFYWRYSNLKWASETIPQVEELARAENFSEAYALALKIKQYLPNDSALLQLMPLISDDLSVSSEPPGASVYLKLFAHDKPSLRRLIGTTPINNLQIARGDYVIEIEKAGYSTFQRSVSTRLDRIQKAIFDPAEQRREVKMIETKAGNLAISLDANAPIRIQARLIPTDQALSGMTLVPGGEYKLTSYGKPTDDSVRLNDFYIDQFEVSNRDFKEFVSAGGYLKRQFWKHSFIRNGKQILWEEAMKLLIDRTGLPAPRNWSNQNYPDGKAMHPVTDINWYEAAAYAEFRGKQLPNIFQWEKAARNGAYTHFHGFILPWGLSGGHETIEGRANFLSGGTLPVDSLEFGMSAYGCYNMAGNVAEWLANPQAEGFTTAGGSWKDPQYVFANFGAYPGFYNANTLGFRCVLNSANSDADQGAMPLNPADEVPTYKATSEAEFQAMLRHYQYDQTPLDSQIVETIETEAWRREKITFSGAMTERAFAWLYLPKHARTPLQVIHYVPTDAAYYGLTLPEEIEAHAAPYIKAGRAVFAVVLKGYKERPWPPDRQPVQMNSVAFREMVINWATDHRRGLDYLATRSDIDSKKIACFGVSVNPRKLTIIAVENRYAAVILLGAGLIKSWSNMIPETNGANFVSHIRAPKLMINGRYDEAIPFKTEGEPLYKLLREPKQLVVLDQGHVPPLEVTVPIINGWLDKTLGVVNRQ